MSPTTASSTASHWRNRFTRRLLASGDAEYESARRIWNGMIDRRPALIARCITPEDVRTAVKLARKPNNCRSACGVGDTVWQERPFVITD